MRNIIALLLLVTLSSNECNAPFRAKIICGDNQDRCKVQFHNSLEFLMTAANMSWWKGSLEIGVYYSGKNTSMTLADSIDYNRFSVVCSNGVKFYRTRREIKVKGVSLISPAVYTIPAGKAIDSIFLFVSVDKYSKKRGMEVLKGERFFFLDSHGRTDTLFTVISADSKIK
jgi:hypothetical protein